MFSIRQPSTRLCDGVDRREFIRIGGLGLGALQLPQLLKSAAASSRPTDSSFGRAKNVIFLYLAGGPPQHETFDPKPDAPAEIRGPFQPISTNVPGIQFCELLPRCARVADKLAVVRSLSTDDNIHSSSSHWVLTGYKYQGPNARTIQPTDWPYLGSIVKRYRPSTRLPALSCVWIPHMMRLNENVTPAGQTGGLMGSQWDPELFVGDPSSSKYSIKGLQLRAMTRLRLNGRKRLLDQFQNQLRVAEKNPSLQLYDAYQQQAFDLMTSGKAQRAFAIQDEPDTLRERYGKNRWGQAVLLARRLIEAGVRLVHVQWPREPGDNAVDNPLWDTHAQNFDRLEDVLCPTFDVGYTALLEDLEQRGLLDETLVVAVGEFGRTPKVNPKSGRDHWGHVFSCVLAGAGIAGGQIYGSSDAHGAYPKSDRIEPSSLTATMFHLLGIDHQGTFTDRQGRSLNLTKGTPLYSLLGTSPATNRRVESSGSVERVPPFDPARMLMQTEFDVSKPIPSYAIASRPKGWRAYPNTDDSSALLRPTQIRRGSVTDGFIGFPRGLPKPEDLPADSHAMIGQEVRSPFAGRYLFEVRFWGEGINADEWEAFQESFECRLTYFKFTQKAKHITDQTELAYLDLSPRLVAESARRRDGKLVQKAVLDKNFVNPARGGNHSFGLGMGVAIDLRRKNGKTAPRLSGRTGLRIESVKLTFLGKEVNPDVTF